MRNPRVILITGASSGIGAELAVSYAEPGRQLVLCGRNIERLEEVRERCHARGAMAQAVPIEVTHTKAMWEWLEAVDDKYPVDLIIANAGVSGGTADGPEPVGQIGKILTTNIEGTLNTIHPLLPRMEARGQGQIVLLSSLAGMRGFPGAPSYSASKAFLRIYGEALRAYYYRSGVQVNTVCPGFVDTPMTVNNPYPMPFLMSPEKAAKKIKKRLMKNKSRISFPWPMVFTSWVLSCLPVWMADPILRSTPKK